ADARCSEQGPVPDRSTDVAEPPGGTGKGPTGTEASDAVERANWDWTVARRLERVIDDQIASGDGRGAYPCVRRRGEDSRAPQQGGPRRVEPLDRLSRRAHLPNHGSSTSSR